MAFRILCNALLLKPLPRTYLFVSIVVCLLYTIPLHATRRSMAAAWKTVADHFSAYKPNPVPNYNEPYFVCVCAELNIFRQLHLTRMGHGSCWFYPPLSASQNLSQSGISPQYHYGLVKMCLCHIRKTRSVIVPWTHIQPCPGHIQLCLGHVL